jgi:phosphohistidine phosphatase
MDEASRLCLLDLGLLTRSTSGEYSKGMKVLLVRHAPALARGTPGVLDAERPLTPSGRAKFSVAARGLARIVGRVDVLMTSPLTRARETAEIAAGAFVNVEPVIESALAGDRVDAIVAALATRPRESTVALVGHEPMLATLLAHLVGSPDGERFAFKKGGAALVDLPDGRASKGRLVWFLPPRVLRALAGAVGTLHASPIGNGQAAVARRNLS